ncbi:MAG: hypothetical protein AUK07_00665 [Parcubacteria group bacterium CG2_30_36_21]|nr:MAG: hypothetical protein AUK07_00665 [Parcubacteria group bacterium CG2_30_36_21]
MEEKIKIVKLEDKEYPLLLKKIANPPKILYIKGELLKKEKCFAIVGTRRSSNYGKEIAFSIAKDLSEAGLTIVSGMARGIDTFAHKGALEGEGPARNASHSDAGGPARNASHTRAIAKGEDEQSSSTSDAGGPARNASHSDAGGPARNASHSDAGGPARNASHSDAGGPARNASHTRAIAKGEDEQSSSTSDAGGPARNASHSDAGGRTIAVLGTGIDEKSLYPKENLKLARKILENKGCLVSEYPPGSPGLKQNFPERNRIISGLSLGVLIVEAKFGSGALITANWAKIQGKKIFALPGSIHFPNSQGCHFLIKQGAKLAENANDILKEFNLPCLTSGVKQVKGKTLEEQLILEVLKQENLHIDKIIEKTKLSPQVVSSILTLMEIENKVKNLGGNVYIITR